jgi:hypothetical protein
VYVAAEHSASIAVFERDLLSGLLPALLYLASLHLNPYVFPYTRIPTPASFWVFFSYG